MGKYKITTEQGEYLISTAEANDTTKIETEIPQKRTVGGFVKNIPKSAGQFFTGIGQAIGHPIKTISALEDIAIGAITKTIPSEKLKYATEEQQQKFEQLSDFFKQRYGGVENIKKTIYEDPVGFASDISTFLTSGGAIAGRIPTLAKIGGMATKVGRAIEPLTAGVTIPLKAGFKTLEKVTGFKKAYRPEIEAIAKERGIVLPAGAVSDSKLVKSLENVAGRQIMGTKINQIVDTAKSQLVELADNTVRKADNTTTLSEAGNIIIQGAENFKQNFFKIKDELYKNINLDEIKEPVNVDTTITQIDKYLTHERKSILGPSADAKVLGFIKQQLKGEKKTATKLLDYKGNPITTVTKEIITPDKLRVTIEKLNEMVDYNGQPLTTGMQGKLKSVIASLSESLDETIKQIRPEIKEALDTANNYYKQGIEKINSGFGRKISQFKNKPDELAKIIVTPKTSAQTIPDILEVVGTAGADTIRKVTLENIFNKAKTGEVLSSNKLNKVINEFGTEKLNALFTPEQNKVIKDIQTLVSSLETKQKTTGLDRLMSTISLQSFFINSWVGLKMLLGNVLYSKLIGSNAGQQFLRGKMAIPELQPITQKAGLLYQIGRAGEKIDAYK